MKKFLAYLLLFSFLIVSLFACSSKDNTTPASPPPSIVRVQFRADAENGEVTLDWQMVADATSYNIYYGTTSSNLTKISTTPAVLIGPPYTVTSLTNGTTYYFALSAVNASGESDLSNPISAIPNDRPPPAAPTNIRANAGNAEVTVSWNTVPGASSYNLYCWDGSSLGRVSIINIPDPGQPTASYDVNTVTWNVGIDVETPPTELVNENPYIFYLSAETAESGSSAVVSATPSTTSSTTTVLDGNVVTSISATTGTTGQVTITWIALGTATPYTSYNLYYYPTLTPGDVNRIPEFENGYFVSGLTDRISYSFYLKSVTESSGSFAVTAMPTRSTNPLPDPPNLSSATAGDGTVTLAWTPPTTGSAPTSYNIYWSTLPNVTKTIGAATIGLLPLTATATLVNGTTYYFVVTAVNANGESMESNEMSATPTP